MNMAKEKLLGIQSVRVKKARLANRSKVAFILCRIKIIFIVYSMLSHVSCKKNEHWEFIRGNKFSCIITSI